ncbi:transcription factor TFIIB cyclin-related protein [Nitzschia inconspicua]|uniref:B-related factor 1 n=1 Tax=Nitzschia inconspicua TaxID=303405 RepID=A0A9K3KEQ6_9STRA|nr:transcription factor TFIIB cyclin-related protein [Nitzschia inconspicua]
MDDALKGACPNCGSTAIETQDASGNSVCTQCGVVCEENAIVSSVEFVEGTGGASSMVGQFVSATSRKAYTGGRAGGNYGFSRDSRETTLANGRRKIQGVASRLRLGGHYVDAAHRLFTIAVEKNFVQGRRTIHVVAACLYIACRQEKSQHMLIDFSDALQVNVYTLGTCFLKFRRLLGLKLEILDPALYVYRFAAHLGLDDKANAVALTALRLVGRMKRDWIVAGRRPAGICAAALLISARAHGFSRHQRDVTRILRVCGMTVNTRVKEFEKTPSASLTLDQFNRVDLETEADPPVFTKNRIMEARARAVQEKNIELLASGALDDPMATKRTVAKWRDGKMSAKAEAFEQLYKSLEMEMTETLNKSKLPDESGEDNEEDEEEKEEEQQLDSEQQGETQTDENKEVAHESVGTTASQGECETQHKESAETGIVDRTEITERNEVGEVHHWEKSYPIKNGKKLILPDQATEEERKPPTQPVEGQLDIKAWRETMPQESIDEIDSIFLSPEEVAQKEAIFNKINKDYIEIQAQKEKNRNTEEQAISSQEKELAEQAQGLERYRKRKDRGKDSAETTEEALLQAVASRKISRKINYDAMSAIFEDGNFSTGGTVTTEETTETDVGLMGLVEI